MKDLILIITGLAVLFTVLWFAADDNSDFTKCREKFSEQVCISTLKQVP